MAKRHTAPALGARKVANGEDPLVMVTAYDFASARWVDASDADMILVGDSLAMVVLGHDDTLSVTVDDMAHHTAAVARAEPTRGRGPAVDELPRLGRRDAAQCGPVDPGRGRGGEARGWC